MVIDRNTVTRIEAYLNRFVSFEDSTLTLPIALWILGTYLWEGFDAFPYLVITSHTKRSGKTRLSELMAFLCNRPKQFGAMTPATLFHSIDSEKPTIFFDEAEILSNESASTMRAVLNMGYRKGQSVPRQCAEYYNAETQSMSRVREFATYCPKVYILIGDVLDTLRDRSIIIQMKRGEPKERFVYENAKADGELIKQQIATEVASRKAEVWQAFTEYKGIPFLTDRDEEIWTPIFTLASVFCKDRITELSSTAVDLATLKTVEAKRYVNLQEDNAEGKARDDEYSRILLKDMATVLKGKEYISSIDLIEALKAMPTAPWRKFRGEGITAHNLADMLSRHGVKPGVIRTKGGKKNSTTMRGYRYTDVKKATAKL